MSFTTFDMDVPREPSPEKLRATAASVSPSVDAQHGRISLDPFVVNQNPGVISAAPSHRNPSSSPSQYNPPPTNAAIDLVIANAMANAPAQAPNYHAADPHARIGNEITRVRTPSAINNLFPAAVGIDGRVNLFVGNLPYRVRWQDLKDLFRRAGTVLRADVSLGQDNRSRGYGTVLMGSREDGAKAIDMFNGYNWQTRTLEVRPDRLPPEYEPQVGQTQHPPFHNVHPMNNQHHGPMFPNFSNPMNGLGHHIQQQPQFFRPPVALHGPSFGSNGLGVGTPMAAPPMIGHSSGNLPFQHSQPLQKGLSPLPTGAVPQPQPFTGRPTSQPQLGVPVFPPGQLFGSSARVGSFSSMTSANETRKELSPGLQEPIAMNRAASLSPHSLTPAPPGAIGEKLPSGPASSSGSVSGGSSGRAPPPVGLGPLPPSVLSNAASLHSPASLSPDTAGSNERPFGALGNGGMSRPPVCHPMGQTTGRVLFIGNLPFQCQWQDLKDLLRPAGNIVRADVALGPDNRSRGYGTVLFANESDAQNAVRMFNGFEYNGRAIKVYIDRNNDRHNSAPNQPPPRNQFQPYVPQPFYGQQQRPFAQPGPGAAAPWHQPVGELQSFGAQTAQNSSSDNATRKSPILPLKVDTAISLSTDAQPAVSQSKPSGGKHPHPGPITMPSFPNFTNGNPLSPLQTRGLPPMTPSMPGFVFNAHPQTPPLHPHFLSPGFAPFSPGAPVTSPTVYQYNPFMNAAPGAPVTQNGAQGGTGVPAGRWNSYTAGLRTPQGNASSNGDYFPALPKLDTSVSAASSSAAASPLNAKQQRFVSLTAAPAAAQGSPDLNESGDLLSSAIQTLSVNGGTSPESKLRAGRSSIDFTKPGSLSAAWNEAPGERRASWDVATKEQEA